MLEQLPPDTGMAFVLIQHLSATHTSFLSEALGRATPMPVTQAGDGMRLKPDHVYVIPPGEDMEVSGDVLTLRTRVDEPRKAHLPVDIFLRSLAATRGSRAIGVILSGTASDGTEGLRAIREQSGITLAQSPRSAKFGEMPQSAVQAGVVDRCLELPQLAQELVRLSQHGYVTTAGKTPPRLPEDDDALRARLFALVRSAVGVDFSEYKPATVQRRLARRMALHRVEGLRDYVKLLEQSPDEARALYEDVLIHVTSFFRDPEAFEALKRQVFPVLLEHKPDGAPLRLWSAGCSTGEEVYSLAISLLEFLGEARRAHPVQIFASDISAQAIEKARAGLYPESALGDLSPERRVRFFTKVDGGYRISKAVRELCVFVRHDLARDPPFSKLDLVTCRNVFIYFAPELQKRVLATFHYCLNTPGFLLLGRTENISGFSQLFTPASKAQKLLARVEGPSRLRFTRGSTFPSAEKPVGGRVSVEPPRTAPDAARRVDRLLLSRYAPPGVVVNDKLEVVQFRGHTGPYLESAPGEPQLNLLKMVREGLLSPLRVALSQARKKNAPSRMQGAQVDPNGVTRVCDIVVVPISGLLEENEPLFLVTFEEVPLPVKRGKKPVAKPSSPKAKGQESHRVPALKLELDAMKDYLHSVLEEHGRTNDELAFANGELVSSNEELQSLNEELETAKEELQSTNEELTTVNDELHSRNQEMSQVNGDLLNLLNTVDIPVVILDLERRIRRFTPKARSIMNVLPSDVGRPLEDITLNINVADLGPRVAEVMESALARELEVQDRSGRWYRMHLRPYQTTDHRIDGAILSLVDIDALKHHVSQVEWARDYASGIVEAVQVPLMVLDADMRVLSANHAFFQAYGGSPAETVAKPVFELSGGAWDVPELRASLGQMLARNTSLQGLELEHVFPRLGRRRMSLSARSVHSRTGVPMLLLAIEDITERQQREQERAELLTRAQQAKEEAERANRAKDQFLATLSHELRTPLSTMLMQAQLLRRGPMDEARLKRAGEAIERGTKLQVQLIDDLLDVSRIVTGKMRMQLQTVHLPSVVQAALESVSAQADKKAVSFEVFLDSSLGPVSGDPTRLQQIFWNLLSNAIKFSPDGQQVSVKLERRGGYARLQVSDKGAGIEPEALPRIFDRFMQEDSSNTRVFGGLGLGLAIVRHLVELHEGSVQAESPGRNQGATFTVQLPLLSGPAATAGDGSPSTEEQVRGRVPSRSREAASRLAGLRVLVVDDDPGTREAAAEVLRLAGAEARTAESAEEALALVEDLRPDVLLSDIAMPGEDGYTLIRKVRALGPLRGGDVPAIAFTALVGGSARTAALGAGFQRHLAKPLDIDRLVEAVEQCRAGAAPAKPGPANTVDEGRSFPGL
ncbi:CheR family methyltransferase [Pyxidicoccus xibeiensis]|uniref:CheR family methyltransferase n=1 Tax=Pyxidicoccus xibeiensis TaxID=2906759 RepID=UPI0020A734D1|nr:ATP-binding protein [Pyxidicoccus xibeiensis]